MSVRLEPGRLLPFRRGRADDDLRDEPMSQEERAVLADARCTQALALEREVMWFDAWSVASATGLKVEDVQQALRRLEKRGLVHAAMQVRRGRPARLMHALTQAIVDNLPPHEPWPQEGV